MFCIYLKLYAEDQIMQLACGTNEVLNQKPDFVPKQYNFIFLFQFF